MFRRASAVGWMEVGLKVASSVCCERSSVRPGAMRMLEVRLLSDAPLRSLVPWYEAKKNALLVLTGPPSSPPKTLRLSTGRSTPAAFRNGLLALKASSRKYSYRAP